MNRIKRLEYSLERIKDLEEDYVARAEDPDQITLEIDYATEARSIFKELLPTLKDYLEVHKSILPDLLQMGRILRESPFYDGGLETPHG